MVFTLLGANIIQEEFHSVVCIEKCVDSENNTGLELPYNCALGVGISEYDDGVVQSNVMHHAMVISESRTVFDPQPKESVAGRYVLVRGVLVLSQGLVFEFRNAIWKTLSSTSPLTLTLQVPR